MAALHGIDGFLDDSERWRRAVGQRVPTYRELLRELEAWLRTADPAARRVRARLSDSWRARTFTIFYDRPLLVLASLRLAALSRGQQHPLWSALAAPEPVSGTVTRRALCDALEDEGVWRSLEDRHLQTNETSRAVAWLWPAHLIGCDDGARPLALIEIGTAAGLLLSADRLPNRWADARGSPLPIVARPRTVLRLGLDARPLDTLDDHDVAWLRSCVWAGETERLELLEAAIAAFRKAPPAIEMRDAAEAPRRISEATRDLPPDTVVLAFQTVMRDYLDDATAAAYDRGMRQWLAERPLGTALWAELEGGDRADQAALTVHAHAAHGSIADLVVATTAYHPTTVVADEASVEQLRALFGRT